MGENKLGPHTSDFGGWNCTSSLTVLGFFMRRWRLQRHCRVQASDQLQKRTMAMTFLQKWHQWQFRILSYLFIYYCGGNISTQLEKKLGFSKILKTFLWRKGIWKYSWFLKFSFIDKQGYIIMFIPLYRLIT